MMTMSQGYHQPHFPTGKWKIRGVNEGDQGDTVIKWQSRYSNQARLTLEYRFLSTPVPWAFTPHLHHEVTPATPHYVGLRLCVSP